MGSLHHAYGPPGKCLKLHQRAEIFTEKMNHQLISNQNALQVQDVPFDFLV